MGLLEGDAETCEGHVNNLERHVEVGPTTILVPHVGITQFVIRAWMGRGSHVN